MIALGIDPGARWTAFALVDTMGDFTRRPELIESVTIDRKVESALAIERGLYDETDLLDLPAPYLLAVAQTTEILARYDSSPPDVVGVEWIRRPSWRVKGREKPLDPSAIMATAIVLGGIVEALAGNGHTGPERPLVRVRPMGNGHLFPLNHYPGELATTGAGQDKHRHERSAYDVAVMAAQQHNTRRS